MICAIIPEMGCVGGFLPSAFIKVSIIVKTEKKSV
jgi:hypothetical protein